MNRAEQLYNKAVASLPDTDDCLVESLKEDNNRLRQRILNLEQRIKDLMLDKVEYMKKGGFVKKNKGV